MAKQYRVLVDSMIEGNTHLAGAIVPNTHTLTVFPDSRAEAYVEAGMIEEIVTTEDEQIALDDIKMLANPPAGSLVPPPEGVTTGTTADGDTTLVPAADATVEQIAATLNDGGQTQTIVGTGDGTTQGNAADVNTVGILNPDAHTKDALLAIAARTPNAVYQNSDTKAEIAAAINTAVASNALDANRANDGATQE